MMGRDMWNGGLWVLALMAVIGCSSAHERDAGAMDAGIEVRCGEISYCWPALAAGSLLPYCSLSCDASAGWDKPLCRGSDTPGAPVMPREAYCLNGETPFCAPPRPDRCE